MSAAPSSQSSTPSNDTARAAGRGGIAVLGAKAFFILSGLLQQTLLPRVIGLAGFGALSRVLAVANVVNNVVVASATQGVSRAVARAQEHHREALRAALRVHLVAALGAAALFALASPLVAAFEGASYISLPLVVMAGVVACYGVYAAFVGALNGTKRFSQQAALDVTFAVLRTVGILGLGWLFMRRGQSGVVGATLGFVLAAACIVPLAARWTGLGKAAPGPLPDVPSAPAYVKGLVPVAIAQLFTNAVMQIDITLLGHFLSASATGVDASKQADVWIGVYRACQLFAFLPYQLLFSVTQILFPLVASAHAGGSTDEVRQYVARGARIGAIACGLMVAVIVAMPGSLLAFAFPAEIAERGASTLRILALGQGAFAMMGLAATVLVSLGRERDAALITLAALLLVGIGCFGVVPWQPFGGAQLFMTAIATTVALVIGLGLAAVRVTRVAGAFIPVKTAARVAFGVALALVAGFRLPTVGKLLTPIEAAGIGVLFVGILAALGELGKEDAALVTALVRRRGGAKA